MIVVTARPRRCKGDLVRVETTGVSGNGNGALWAALRLTPRLGVNELAGTSKFASLNG